MGRSRGSSGSSSRRSSGGSRRSSSRSHSSSSRSSSSRSYGSSSYSSGRSYGYRPSTPVRGYHHPPMHSHNTTHVHYHGSGYNGYSGARGVVSTISKIYTTLFVIVFLFIIFAGILPSVFSTSYYANQIDEEAVAQYAESRYNFKDESHLLLFYTYLEESDTDYATLIFGYDASDIISNDLEDYFWEVYDDNFYSDLNDSQWLGYTFAEIADEYKKTSNGTKLNNLKSFDKNCYEDSLNYIKSNEKSDLIDGLKKFYDETGIQVYIILMPYEDIPGVTIQESTAGRFGNKLLTIGIIAVVGFVVIKIVKAVINKKKKEQEEMERILNTPLEKLSDPTTEELKDKYDQT